MDYGTMGLWDYGTMDNGPWDDGTFRHFAFSREIAGVGSKSPIANSQ
jgi:hypothetical protein